MWRLRRNPIAFFLLCLLGSCAAPSDLTSAKCREARTKVEQSFKEGSKERALAQLSQAEQQQHQNALQKTLDVALLKGCSNPEEKSATGLPPNITPAPLSPLPPEIPAEFNAPEGE